jgi:hypothetical protein
VIAAREKNYYPPLKTLFCKESIELIEFGGFFVEVNTLKTPLPAKGHFRVNRVFLPPHLFAYGFG